MTIQWTPIRDYQDTYHVLGAAPCFCHPGNGNIYFYACEKVDAAHQNLVIYRHVAATGVFEHVVSFIDGDASQGFIERGGCVIDSAGTLWVATSLQPKGKAYDQDERTGYEGVWCKIPNVDAPYVSTAALLERIARLEAFFAVPGTLTLGPQNNQGAGGEIRLADGKGGVISLDATNGSLRIFLNGPSGKVTMTLTP